MTDTWHGNDDLFKMTDKFKVFLIKELIKVVVVETTGRLRFQQWSLFGKLWLFIGKLIKDINNNKNIFLNF